MSAGIWECRNKSFLPEGTWGAKGATPQIFPGLESPVSIGRCLKSWGHPEWILVCPSGTKWDQKRLLSSFFSPSLLLQERVESPAPAGPFLPWNTFSTILHREKNAGLIFFSSPDLCEHRTQQQLRSGQGGTQFIVWNTTQQQQSRDGNVDPSQQGKGLCGKGTGAL